MAQSGLTYSEYNRLLKYTAKQAALADLKSDNVFSRAYLKMTLEKGIASHRAELTIARDIWPQLGQSGKRENILTRR
jgi:hypothetical protein